MIKRNKCRKKELLKINFYIKQFKEEFYET